MPRYIASHIIACMPNQRLQKLLTEIQTVEGGIKCLRAFCDTVQGRMICEYEAPDGDALAEWLKERRMSPQWVFRLEFYAENGEVVRL